MASPFTGMPASQRGAATRLMNGYDAQVAEWQRQYEDFGGVVGYPLVQLKDYIGVSDFEKAEVRSYAALKQMLNARRNEINDRIESQAQRANRRHGRGMPDGQRVYMAVAFNHGAGALFLGYLDTEDPDYSLTHVEDWAELPSAADYGSGWEDVNDLDEFF